jgi:hypothetical protein
MKTDLESNGSIQDLCDITRQKEKISPTSIKNYVGTSRGMEGSINGT